MSAPKYYLGKESFSKFFDFLRDNERDFFTEEQYTNEDFIKAIVKHKALPSFLASSNWANNPNELRKCCEFLIDSDINFKAKDVETIQDTLNKFKNGTNLTNKVTQPEPLPKKSLDDITAEVDAALKSGSFIEIINLASDITYKYGKLSKDMLHNTMAALEANSEIENKLPVIHDLMDQVENYSDNQLEIGREPEEVKSEVEDNKRSRWALFGKSEAGDFPKTNLPMVDGANSIVKQLEEALISMKTAAETTRADAAQNMDDMQANIDSLLNVHEAFTLYATALKSALGDREKSNVVLKESIADDLKSYVTASLNNNTERTIESTHSSFNHSALASAGLVVLKIKQLELEQQNLEMAQNVLTASSQSFLKTGWEITQRLQGKIEQNAHHADGIVSEGSEGLTSLFKDFGVEIQAIESQVKQVRDLRGEAIESSSMPTSQEDLDNILSAQHS